MFKPLLAPREVPATYPAYWSKLTFPILGSPKYDGIRGCVRNGVVLSRTGKPLPSLQVQEDFGHLTYCDGEIIEGTPTDADVYNRTQSHVMSGNKPGNLKYFVFDYTKDLYVPFKERNRTLYELTHQIWHNVFCVEQMILNSLEELLEYEEVVLAQGFEGIMLRDADAPYKTGRATMNEGIIFKLKRFIDTEGILVDIEEEMTNTNTQETDELGYAKRSSAKAGLVGAKKVGMFVVSIPWNFVTKQIDPESPWTNIRVAPGNFDHKQRKEIWDCWPRDQGRMINFRYFPIGIKDYPRHPRAKGFRDEMDI